MGKVLLTGGSGFVASHIVLVLLRHKHHVVATVRSESKVDALRAIVPADAASLITYAIVEDVSVPHAFDAVLTANTFDGVIHTAAPFHIANKTPGELLDPGVHGTKYLLDSLKRHAPTVKRFVFTSSHAALVDMSKLHRPGYVYTADDWCPIDWKTANEFNPVNNYLGAKKFGELAVWEAAKENPNLTVVTLCPPSVYGPLLIRPESMASLNTTSALIYAYINGFLKGGEVPAQYFHGWVDARNLAEAHVAAYEKPEAANRRFVVGAGNHTYKEIAVLLAKNFPDAVDNIPTKLHDGLTPSGAPVGGCHTFDTGPSREVLGIEYISLEKSLVDTVNRLREFEIST